MPSIVAYESSSIDWCEENFKYSPVIAEYYNTVSNVVFFLLPPLMVYLSRSFASNSSWHIHLLWLSMTVVGGFSAYFHMTLSFLGQMLDELSILWILSGACILWFPKDSMPLAFRGDRWRFGWFVTALSTCCTVLAFLKPNINAYALNSIGIYVLYVMYTSLRWCKTPTVHRLAWQTVLWWFLAVGCWLSDRMQCPFWSALDFTYLHSMWHVFIAMASCHCLILFAYLNVLREVPEKRPLLKYWPRNNWQIGIPYILLNSRSINAKIF
uniref:alkaline ceramidase 1-like isoform X1 n=1 Tax=Myxine glutinosa TaxID=7769 RepID=UPI00358FE1B1